MSELSFFFDQTRDFSNIQTLLKIIHLLFVIRVVCTLAYKTGFGKSTTVLGLASNSRSDVVCHCVLVEKGRKLEC